MGTIRDVSAEDLLLRNVTESDLPIFFEQQLDAEANHMAAFTADDPSDQEAFRAHWTRILLDETVTTRTIVVLGQVVGHVLKYEELGRPEVSYWIGRDYWGRGIASLALATFLAQVRARPLYARAARDNLASLRVLQKCGFVRSGESRGFATARGCEIDEVLLYLPGDERDTEQDEGPVP